MISYCIYVVWVFDFQKIVWFPHYCSVDRKSFLFMMLLLTVTIVYGTLTQLLHYSVLFDFQRNYFEINFIMIFPGFFFAYILFFLTLATEGLIFETDGNEDMLDIFWQQRRHICLFWHQQSLYVASLVRIWRYELFEQYLVETKLQNECQG